MSTDFPGPFGPEESSFSRIYRQGRDEVHNVTESALKLWHKQPVWRKLLLILAVLSGAVLGALFLVYHEFVLHLIVEYADKWAELPWMPVLLMFLLFIVSFPPLIGFSLLNTVVGALYGISFKGWFIIAFASITGSVVSFIVFRYAFKERAKALIRANQKLHAFSSVLQDNNSFWLIALIRVCPFPYSLCNGALSAVPGLKVWNYFLGSLISSPKLVMYLFVGQKVKDIGKATDTWTRIVDVLSIFATLIFLTLTGWLLFTKTSERLRLLEEARVNDLERQLSDGYDDNLSMHTQDL